MEGKYSHRQLSKELLVLALVFLIQTGLKTTEAKAQEPIIVRYEIKSPDFKSIEIMCFSRIRIQTREIRISRDTVFFDTIHSIRPLYLKVNAKEEFYLHAEPGSRIRILIHPGSKSTKRVRFRGDLSDINTYLLEVNDLEKKAGNVLGMVTLPVEAYVSKVDSFQLTKSDLLVNSSKKNPSHPFWMQQKTLIELEAPLAKYDFARFYFLNHGDGMLPESREKLMADRRYLISYAEILSIPIMQTYLDDYIVSHSSRLNNRWVTANQSLMKQQGFIKPNSFEFGIRYVIDSVSNEEMRNFLLLKLVQRGLDGGELKPVKTVLSLFYDHCTDHEMIDFVRQEEHYYQGIQPGQMGPNIAGYTPEGTQVSLSELKGKFILVDVWATWCGPCIGGLPDFKKLVEAYQGRNIAFVKYSVDQDRKKWLDFITKNESTGSGCMELISENGTECRLMKDYRFDGIPRYLLFDAKGRIINIRLESPGAILRSKYLDKYLDNPEYR